MKRTILAAALALGPSVAFAAPVVTAVGTSYSATSPYSFSYGDSTFTFTGTGDIFNPTAVSNGGTGQFNTVFGTPTSSFTDRGTVTFGAGDQYAAFAVPTTIRFSNSENFIGLRATRGDQVFYGYAFTTDNLLNGYAFESTAGQTITATRDLSSAVPEPATWAMMITGLGVVGGALRFRRRRATLAWA